MRGGWVYILTNRPNGTLYIGVTDDLVRKLEEHRSGFGSKFVQRYYLKRLVYAAQHEDIQTAIQRETSLKRWHALGKSVSLKRPTRTGTTLPRLACKCVDGRVKPGHDDREVRPS
jgi:putative endonuclease